MSRYAPLALATVVLVALGGCGSLGLLQPQPYEPWHGPVSDHLVYGASLSNCQSSAKDEVAHRTFQPTQIAGQGTKGLISNGPAAAASPATALLILGVGLLSGVGSETTDELLGSQDDVNRVTAWCMRDKGTDTKGWETWDPWLSK